jgi:SRSO17 transposase
MIGQALDAGVPCGWVTGDSIYGGDRKLRFFLEQRQQPFVLAVAANEPLMWKGPRCRQARQIGLSVEPYQWQRISVGDGAKGPRLYEWAWIKLWRLQLTAQEQGQGHWLLMRRSREDPAEVTYYVVFAPRENTTLEQVAQVAGMRWHVRGCAGTWSPALLPPRASAAWISWISMKCALGRPGIGT